MSAVFEAEATEPEEGPDSLEILVGTIEALSAARSAEDVAAIVRSSARRISGADGVTFVLRDGDHCHYLDEDAIAPLWKGLRFPLTACISGWAMLNGRTAVIPDIYLDDRIPHDAYRPTFVKSLVMTPVRAEDPLAAIGAYWKDIRHPAPEEVLKLAMVARATATALENVRLISSLEAAVERRNFLIRELDHRVKNNLAAVRAIAQQTLRTSASPEAFSEALMGRLMALSRSHDLVAREAHGDPRLRDVLEQACVGFTGGRLSLEGPEVRLSAQTAINFQMAFHELATNAARHGALLSPEGRIAVAWRVDPAGEPPQLRLTWTERGGPAPQAPERHGFGLKLVEAGLARPLGGESRLVFEPAGLRFELSVPLSTAIVPEAPVAIATP